jgi:hypothetical protein
MKVSGQGDHDFVNGEHAWKRQLKHIAMRFTQFRRVD